MSSSPNLPAATEQIIPYTGCPLCNCPQVGIIGTFDCRSKPNYHPDLPPFLTWLQCTQCAHAFTQGYLTDAAQAVLFEQASDGQTVGANLERTRALWAPVVDRITGLRQSSLDGIWLDVGFGNGSLLFTAQEWGYSPVGLDLRQTNVDALKQCGIPAFCLDLADFHPVEAIDVISMGDVIEHIPYPGKVLEQAARLLPDNGLLFIATPNRDCIVWQAMPLEGHVYWTELEHCHAFNRVGLIALCAQYGFVPVHYTISTRYRAGMEMIFKKEKTSAPL